ncbi:hypothetical protein F7984_05115 [Pradoshia sp. D12]|uniref:hypothetical protein n=1 Tax=Bacillaceae TaxID=186817 RepID=UPI00080AD0D1|nr:MULTISPECIES: hypothetical protein [Bacillaceae]OCA89932.1 hypothetical protein A8L44_03095 [Bacillus sp. FJAT-27986]QFK70664.1 hypothetical protein F7984_05115 [Pradoshia sp. D12]TPF72459.1 hypothetical protein FHY44_01510 [Bacillus sp. D12]
MNDLLRSMREQIPIDIIYVSNKNIFTKRRILVKSMGEQLIRAYCFNRKLYRTFKKEQILSTQLVYQSQRSS